MAIQETRLDQFAKDTLKKSYDIVFSSKGTPLNGGLCIFSPYNLDNVLEIVDKDHLLALVMNISTGEKVIVGNLYGEPSSSMPKKKAFVESVEESLQYLYDKYPTASMAIAGDINISLDADIQVNTMFKEMINNLGLTDVYRFLYPSKIHNKGYTRYPFKAQKAYPNRLDGIFLSNQIVQNFKIKFKSQHVTSDHMLISIRVKDKLLACNVTKPKLTFKLYQLQNNDHCDLFKKTIHNHVHAPPPPPHPPSPMFKFTII